jgi:superfamily II DNA or RNA helicase
MYQAKQRFEECGIRGIGLVGDGNLEIGSTVTVATFQTLATKLNDPQIRALRNNARGMIIDELHVAASDTWSQTSMAFTEAHYRFGLSGTPLDRSDKRSLIAVGTTGPVIHHTATETLVQSGVLAKPIVFMVKVEQELTKPTYAGLYGEAVIRSSKRNAALVEMTRLAEKPTLVFVTNLKHGNALVAALQKAGLSVAFVQGSMEESQRGNLKNQLLRKEIDVIVSSVVWQEGIDLPELASVIVAGAGRSVIASLQRVGRGMRRAAGKETFEVWDVADVGTRIFENHTKARIAAYRREEFEVRFVDLQKSV